VFTGRPARALRNRLIDEMGDAEALELPAQASLTRALLQANSGASSVPANLGGPSCAVAPRSARGNPYRYAGDGDAEAVAKQLVARTASHFSLLAILDSHHLIE